MLPSAQGQSGSRRGWQVLLAVPKHTGSYQIFPPDFPPDSSLQGGKWQDRMIGGCSETPEFLDETELQDTGQDGLQRFRKPLLYPAELRDQRIDY